jgi:hypothetical protein
LMAPRIWSLRKPMQEQHCRAWIQWASTQSSSQQDKKAKLERAVSGKLEKPCNSKVWTTSFYIALGLAEALCVCVFTALFHPNFEREIKMEQRKETNIPEPSSTTCKERPVLRMWMVRWEGPPMLQILHPPPLLPVT